MANFVGGLSESWVVVVLFAGIALLYMCVPNVNSWSNLKQSFMNSPQYLHILTSHLKGRRIMSYEGPALPVTKPLHVLNTARPLKLVGIRCDLEQSRTQCYVAEFRHMFRCLFSLSSETLAWKQRTVKNALPKKSFLSLNILAVHREADTRVQNQVNSSLFAESRSSVCGDEEPAAPTDHLAIQENQRYIWGRHIYNAAKLAKK